MQEDVSFSQGNLAHAPQEKSLATEYAPLGAAHVADPYHFYTRARREEPIFYSPLIRAWVVSRYDDALTILKDPQRFPISVMQLSDDWYTPEAVELMRSLPLARVPGLLTVDPPEHTRLRSSITRAMSAQRIASLEPRIRHFANQLIDQFAPSTRLDFVERFARPFPVLVISSLLNVPEEDQPQLRRWSNEATALNTTRPTAEQQILMVQSYAALQQYICDLVEQRRKAPQDDLASDLLKAVDAGQAPLSVLEASRLLYLVFSAGFETTVNFLGNCLLVLLSDHAHWQSMQEHPQSIPDKVEELLRFASPVLGIFRRTNQDVELGGQLIPKGAMIQVLLASADHDEAVFHDAETFDPQSEKTNRHIAFGYGVHFCLGAPLARLETRIALEQLSQRLPSLRLVPGQDISYTPNLLFRGLKQLFVEWDD